MIASTARYGSPAIKAYHCIIDSRALLAPEISIDREPSNHAQKPHLLIVQIVPLAIPQSDQLKFLVRLSNA